MQFLIILTNNVCTKIIFGQISLQNSFNQKQIMTSKKIIGTKRRRPISLQCLEPSKKKTHIVNIVDKDGKDGGPFKIIMGHGKITVGEIICDSSSSDDDDDQSTQLYMKEDEKVQDNDENNDENIDADIDVATNNIENNGNNDENTDADIDAATNNIENNDENIDDDIKC